MNDNNVKVLFFNKNLLKQITKKIKEIEEVNIIYKKELKNDKIENNNGFKKTLEKKTNELINLVDLLKDGGK